MSLKRRNSESKLFHDRALKSFWYVMGARVVRGFDQRTAFLRVFDRRTGLREGSLIGAQTLVTIL